MSVHVGAGGQAPAGARPRAQDQEAVVSLEWVLALPLLALAVMGVLEVAGIARDALLVHEAARAGVRAAATSTGTEAVRVAVDETLTGRGPEVEVRPRVRAAGELVTVTVTLERSIGPVSHPVQARAVARVEPALRPGAGSPAP